MIQIRLKKFQFLSFDVFIEHFETVLTSSLVAKMASIENISWQEIVVNIFASKFATEYLLLYVREAVQALMDNEDLLMVSDDIKQELVPLLQELKLSKHDEILALVNLAI